MKPSSRIAVLFSLALAVSVVACVAPMPRATRADAARAASRWPGTSIAELNRGRGILLARCGACHDPPHPDRFPPPAWPAAVQRMRGRAGLDRGEAGLVEKYLMTMSARDRAGGAAASARR